MYSSTTSSAAYSSRPVGSSRYAPSTRGGSSRSSRERPADAPLTSERAMMEQIRSKLERTQRRLAREHAQTSSQHGYLSGSQAHGGSSGGVGSSRYYPPDFDSSKGRAPAVQSVYLEDLSLAIHSQQRDGPVPRSRAPPDSTYATARAPPSSSYYAPPPSTSHRYRSSSTPAHPPSRHHHHHYERSSSSRHYPHDAERRARGDEGRHHRDPHYVTGAPEPSQSQSHRHSHSHRPPPSSSAAPHRHSSRRESLPPQSSRGGGGILRNPPTSAIRFQHADASDHNPPPSSSFVSSSYLVYATDNGSVPMSSSGRPEVPFQPRVPPPPSRKPTKSILSSRSGSLPEDVVPAPPSSRVRFEDLAASSEHPPPPQQPHESDEYIRPSIVVEEDEDPLGDEEEDGDNNNKEIVVKQAPAAAPKTSAEEEKKRRAAASGERRGGNENRPANDREPRRRGSISAARTPPDQSPVGQTRKSLSVMEPPKSDIQISAFDQFFMRPRRTSRETRPSDADTGPAPAAVSVETSASIAVEDKSVVEVEVEPQPAVDGAQSPKETVIEAETALAESSLLAGVEDDDMDAPLEPEPEAIRSISPMSSQEDDDVGYFESLETLSDDEDDEDVELTASMTSASFSSGAPASLDVDIDAETPSSYEIDDDDYIPDFELATIAEYSSDLDDAPLVVEDMASVEEDHEFPEVEIGVDSPPRKSEPLEPELTAEEHARSASPGAPELTTSTSFEATRRSQAHVVEDFNDSHYSPPPSPPPHTTDSQQQQQPPPAPPRSLRQPSKPMPFPLSGPTMRSSMTLKAPTSMYVRPSPATTRPTVSRPRADVDSVPRAPMTVAGVPTSARRLRPKNPIQLRKALPPSIGALSGLARGSVTFELNEDAFYEIDWTEGEFGFSFQRVYLEDEYGTSRQMFLRMLLNTERSTCRNFDNVRVGDVLIKIGDKRVCDLQIESSAAALTRLFTELCTQTPLRLVFQQMDPLSWEGGVEL